MALAEPFLTGAPCWVDLSTSDPDRAITFYTDVFGWRAERAGEEYGGYINFFSGDDRVCGCTGQVSTDAPVAWNIYLRADSADAALAAVPGAGGQVVMPAMQVGPLGTMAFMVDPGGAVVGLWQPGEHRGFTRRGEPGSCGWFELHTSAYEPCVEFYRNVFGWDAQAMSDTPDFRYTTLGGGDAQAAGIMDSSVYAPEGLPALWSVYFSVADADAAVARVVAGGGSVMTPPEDTPYGRIAEVLDPMGGRFKLMAN